MKTFGFPVEVASWLPSDCYILQSNWRDTSSSTVPGPRVRDLMVLRNGVVHHLRQVEGAGLPQFIVTDK